MAFTDAQVPQLHLRTWRKVRGLTMRELAELADTTITTIYRNETGKTRPKPETLQAVADAMRLSVYDLYRNPMNGA